MKLFDEHIRLHKYKAQGLVSIVQDSDYEQRA